MGVGIGGSWEEGHRNRELLQGTSARWVVFAQVSFLVSYPRCLPLPQSEGTVEPSGAGHLSGFYDLEGKAGQL